MPAGRSNRVLFDLIPQRDAEPARGKAAGPTPAPTPTPVAPTPATPANMTGASSATAKPVVRVELKPQDATPTSTSTSTPSTPASQPAGQGTLPRASAYAPRADTHHSAAELAAPRAYQDLPRAAATPHSPHSPHAGHAPHDRPTSIRWPSFLGTSALAVPINLIYLSVAALVILAVGFFIWGRAVGESATMKQLGAGTLDVPPVVEPNASSPQLLPPPTPTPTPTPTPSPNRSAPQGGRPPSQTPAPAIATPAPAGAILTIRGPVMTDPRVADLNYLSLASLGEADANAAIAFLAANGVDAIGVPRVDPGTSRANNQGPTQVYRIYALPGITRDEYAQKLTARTNLEAAVARIGATWQRDHRGPSNFARTMWEKYRP